MEVIVEELQRYGEVVHYGFESSCVFNSCNSLVRVVTLQNCDKEKLPHIITVNVMNEDYELLVRVYGRPPVCLKCNEVGHIRKHCSMIEESNDVEKEGKETDGVTGGKSLDQEANNSKNYTRSRPRNRRVPQMTEIIPKKCNERAVSVE